MRPGNYISLSFAANLPAILVALLVCAASLPAAADEPWPAEPFSQATNLTAIEGSGSNDFYSDLSSAAWNPVTRKLWVCRNGPGGDASKFWAIREDGNGGYEIDYKDGNRGEWTGFGDLEGITVANYNENVVYLIIEGEDKIQAYDVSLYGIKNLLCTWSIGGNLPAYVGGSGSEGIAFIPDSYLTAQGFVDQNGNPYVSHNGMGGLMFIAHQAGGRLYAFDLNRTNGTFTFVGAYLTGYSESCDLAFDRSEGLLYVFHGADYNRVEVVTLGSSVVGSERQLHQVTMFGYVGAGNMEGFAVVSNNDCQNGQRKAFLTIDGGGASSLFMFTQFPCSVSAAYGVDDDGDGVSNCADQCPGTPSGQTVDSHGCSCSQLDTDGDGVKDCDDRCSGTPSGQSVDSYGCSSCQLDTDNDGVNDCDDQCSATPPGQSVDSRGCSCSQLDTDHDGVNDCNDQCPDTSSGQVVNDHGCPYVEMDPVGGAGDQGDGLGNSEADSDRDGVSDALDQCPNTPPGARPNASGCSCEDQGNCPSNARSSLSASMCGAGATQALATIMGLAGLRITVPRRRRDSH